MDEDPSDFGDTPYTTEWSKIAGKSQTRQRKATYSRRGSMNGESSGSSRRKVLKAKRQSSAGSERNQLFSLPLEQSDQEDHIEEEQAWDRRLSVIDEDAFSKSPTPPAVPPRRKIFRRANSVSDVDVAKVPKPPPSLKRSQSVTASAMSMPVSRLATEGEIGRLAVENYNPNFDPLEENATPKRGYSCNIDRSKRKKSRSLFSRSFLDNSDFVSLSKSSSSSNFAHDPDEFDSPQASAISRSSSVTKKNPRILQRGRSLPVFPSPWDGREEEEEENDDNAEEYVPSEFMSPRKRRPPELHLEEFGASLPRQLTSKSRSYSPGVLDCSSELPTPLNEFQHRYNFQTVLSSDDDAVLSNSDISCCTERSEDERMATDHKDVEERKILQPENATVEDVLETMTSEEDVRFLVRAMTRERNQSNRSKTVWSVALASSWTSDRRSAILRWATEVLGFKYTNGGGGVFIMQILSLKGGPLLDLFRNVVAGWDNLRSGIYRPVPEATLPSEFVVPSPRKKSWKSSQRPSMLKCETSSKPLQMDLSPNTLLEGMKNLTMEDMPVVAAQAPQLDVLLENEVSIDYVAPDFPRPSLEHHPSSADLMQHMHGTTPIRPRQLRKPPRLSTQSTASNASMASPFPVTSFMGDLVSTPRVDPTEDCWESYAVDGRDWGLSESCANAILSEMLEELKRNCSESDNDQASDIPTDIGLKALVFDQIESESSRGNGRSECESSSSSSINDFFGMEVSSSSTGHVQFAVAQDHVFEDASTQMTRDILRREKNLEKRRRTALFASAKDPVKTIREARKSMFVQLSLVSLTRSKSLLPESSPDFFSPKVVEPDELSRMNPPPSTAPPLDDNVLLERILDYLQEKELLLSASLVSRKWFEVATNSHANLMLSCVGCGHDESDIGDDSEPATTSWKETNHALSLMERPWDYLMLTFPWACFLSEGAYKKVYRVFNHKFRVEEAVSVMDVEEIRSTGNMSVVGAELAVSVMLGSLVRRGVCPNFVSTRGIFSCAFEPPQNCWGSAQNKNPRGLAYLSPKAKRQPKEPKKRGRYQYIRMELCDEGDAEEFLKRQPDETLTPCQARHILFQIAFALHAGADRFSLKHYDLKLLNVFLQRVKSVKNGEVVLRYGLGEHVFSLRAPKEDTVIAKLADFGTAKVDSTNGQQVTIAQFTTLENTPPEFMILGDDAQQGHGHDNFGLGLCMLHLFTGHAPYEEILEEVVCPPNLMAELRKLWEDEEDSDYSVVRSLVLSGVFKDDDGHILDGEPDEVLYNTLYKFLVLFGLPGPSDQRVLDSKVMAAIKKTIVPETSRNKKGRNGNGRKARSDFQKFNRDRKKYSLSHGNNWYISRARDALLSMDGGMDLLLSLVQFNPDERATALEVLNSSFMAPLREMEGCEYSTDDKVMSFTALSTQSENS